MLGLMIFIPLLNRTGNVLLLLCAVCGLICQAINSYYRTLVLVLVLSCVCLFVTLLTVALQASLSMEFSREEYWSGLLCPPPGDLPDSEIKTPSFASSALADRLFTNMLPRKPDSR